MGQSAEDIYTGTTCQLCGQFFVDDEDEDALYEHGYPVVCWECWRDLSKKERKQYQRALVKTL